MSLKFVGLHSHSLSVGDSIGYPEDHFKFVLENGGDALAITDHGQANSFGYLFQAKAALKKRGEKFKPILGCELYIHPDLDDWKKSKDLKEQEKEEEQDVVVEVEKDSKDKLRWFDPIRRRHHMVILAQNFEGFQNLNRIITYSYRHGFYRYPRVDFKTLQKYNKGLIISTACLHPDAEIHTNFGLLSIKDVVEKFKNNEEIQVLGYNEQEKKAEFFVVKWGDKTRTGAKLFKIKLKNGKELKLTPDHKVFTDKGWIEAQNLTKEHKILSI